MSVEARLNTKAQLRRLGIALAILLAGVMGLLLGASVAEAATPVGVQWTSQTSAANTEWTSIAWGGPTGSQLFVAVGRYYNGTVTTVMTSPDGITWTSRTATANVYWTSVAWGGPPGNEKFVAVAFSGNVMTSPDGITWTSRTPAASKQWTSVTWGGPAGQEKFVAVNSNNASDAVMTSPDGVTWTAQTIPSNGMWASVTWGGATGNQKFVAVAGFGVASTVMTSSDGITWAPTPVAAPGGGRQWSSVAWGGPAGNQRFVAVASNAPGVDQLMTSPDGLTWTTSNQAAAGIQWRAVAWGGPVGDQTFVAVGAYGSGNRVMTSPDGITWTSQTSPIDAWTAVASGGPAGGQKFVAVAGSGGVMTSVSTLTAPGTPSITSATPTASTVALAFTADDSGGSQVTRLEFALDDTATVDDSTASLSSPYTLTGLTPGSGYTVYMRAVNTIGTGPWSASQFFRTFNVPGAPTVTGVTPAMSTAGVAFTADDSGGSQVTRLEFALDDTVTVDDSTTNLVSPFTLSNLAPGTGHTVYMRAVNTIGTGPWSAGTSFTTLAPPGPVPASAPTGVVAVGSDGRVEVRWQEPSSSGSYPVTQYLATATPGGRTCLTAETSCTITGLANGTSYTVSVQALTGVGWSTASAPSNPVTPRGPDATTLRIVGSRGEGSAAGTITIEGTSTGLVGAAVTLKITFPGQAPTTSTTPITVASDGTFTWSRKTNKQVRIVAMAGGIRSTPMTIPAR